MTNKEFLLEVQKSCHIEMPRCLMLMGCLQKMLGNAAVDQVAVALPGLGTFTSHKHPEYVQENSETGAMTLFPPRITYHLQSDQGAEGSPCALLLAEYAHVEYDEAASFTDSVAKTINKYLQSGSEIDVPGIGIFKNVIAHQSDLKHVDFLPCDQMKELVNAPFSCFEAVEISDGVHVKVVEEETHNAEEPVVEAKEEVAPVTEKKSVSIKEEEVVEPVKIIDKGNYIIVKQPDRHKRKDDSVNWVLYTSVSLIMIGCCFLLWMMFGDSLIDNKPPVEAIVIESVSEKTPVVQVKPDVQPEVVDEPLVDENPVVDEKKFLEEITTPVVKTEPKTKIFHRMKNDDGKEIKVTLQAGSRLTLIALEHFGDKAFWPYIFEVNSDRLKAPNLVKSGMELYLPDPGYYGIDANDPESLQKAKNKAAQLLK